MFKYILIVLTVSCVFSAQTFKCEDGEYVNTETTPNKCKSCPQYCTKCSSSSVCTSCSERYFLYNNASCQLKTIITASNCVNIADTSSPAVCKVCADGFWLNTTSSTCVAVSLTTCKTWASGVSETCVTYNCTKIHEKCSQCSSDSVCTGCESAYFLANSTTCTLKTGNCGTWKEETTEQCQSCPDGYSIVDTKYCYATQCLYSTNITVSCGNKKARSSAPFCNVSCSNTNCLDCIDATAGQCLECDSGFLLSAGACITRTEAMTNCIKTNDADATKCITCKTGFTALSDGSCQTNLDNCTTMANTENCSICENGFYVNANTPITCTACGTHCTCSSATCSGCLDGYFFDSSVGTENCNTACGDEHCLTCSATGTGKCTKCESGYGKEDAGTCTKCVDSHCTSCGVLGKTCTVCSAGYYVDKSESDEEAICVECTTTNSKYVKTSCNDTSRVDFPWTCQALTGNCASNNPVPLIGEAEQSCKTCSPGYLLSSNSCTACLANCYTCSSNSVCTECNFGYYLNDTDKSCVACSSNCSKCSSSECLDCKSKYAYSTDNTSLCVGCLSNCDRCDLATACIKCSIGYYLAENNTCVGCSTNCSECSDASTCFTCLDGSYLNGTACKECLENCKVCTGSTSCTTCNTGYELNNDHTACTKSSTSVTGRECLESVSGCIKCDSTTPTTCVLCSSGSIPANNKCTCESGLLIGGSCVAQSTETLPDDLSSTDLATLKTYVTKALETESTKANNTKKILSRISTILSAENTDANAGVALQLLLQFAATTTETEAQESYSTILTTTCSITTLSESNYYIAFAAADKFMSTATDKKSIYVLGFSTCLTNLLKNVESVSDISPMTLTNSEFMMSKFTKTDINKTLELTGVSITANDAFMTAVGDGTFYATVQAIPNAANPYASEQTNTDITLSSKIVSFSVMTSGSSAGAKTITLSNGSFPLTFDTAGSSGKCGYYDTTNKKWVQDGELNDKICNFTHLTDFVIFKDTSSTSGDNAYMRPGQKLLVSSQANANKMSSEVKNK